MAFTATGLGVQSSAGPASSLVVSSVSAVVGAVLVVSVAAANSGTSGAAVTATCTDSAGNTYTKRVETNNTAGVSDDGITLFVFTTVVTSALSSGSVTVSFSPSSAQGCAMTVRRYIPGTGRTASFVSAGAGSTGNGTTPSITSGSIATGEMIIGFLATEANGTVTDDADTTNGSWSAKYEQGVSGAKIASQDKTVSASAAQTFNPTLSGAADYATNYIIISDVGTPGEIYWEPLPTNSTTSSAASLALTSVSAPVGSVLYVAVSANNSGTNGAACTTTCADDSAESGTANTWTQQTQVNNDPGAADAGITLTIFTSILTRALVADTITVSFSPNTTCVTITGEKGILDSGTASVVTVGAGATGTGTTPSITSGSITSGDIIIGAVAAETNGSITADADTSDGTWSTQISVTADTGTAGTSTRLVTQRKKVTATATQTYNPTIGVSRDWATNYIVVRGASTAKTIATDAGSYAVTGTDANLEFGRRAGAAAGSYAVTGTAATLRRGFPVLAAAGSYAVTGQTASFLRTWRVSAASGSYSISGQAATLSKSGATYSLTAAAGSYLVSGQVAALYRTVDVVGASGSYVVTGTDATLTIDATNPVLGAGAGSYSVGGQAASLKLGRRIAANSNSYAVSGQAAGFRWTRAVVADAGSYSVAGSDATLSASGEVSQSFTSAGRRSGTSYAYRTLTEIRRDKLRELKRIAKRAQKKVEQALEAPSEASEFSGLRSLVQTQVADSVPARAPWVTPAMLESMVASIVQYQRSEMERAYQLRLEQEDEEDIEILLLVA